jgi:AhpC/TSA family
VRNVVITKLLGGLLLSTFATGFLSCPAHGQSAAPESLKLRVGDPAPDFKLQYFDGNDLKDVHLSDYRGKKNVVLAFYIFAFTGG